MSNNNPPFAIGQRVVVVYDTKNPNNEYPEKGIFDNGDIVRIKDCLPCGNKWDVELYEDAGWAYPANCFRPIQPLYEDIREELAKQVVIADSADQPVREIVNN